MDGLVAFSISTIVILAIISIWSLIWRGLGLWHSARDSKSSWFIVILLFSDLTIGILPIIYIYLIRKRKKKKR